ncbi:hypothetical protein HanRHA438_Chr15g0700641 [Helianthus annuus]|nr:hypothetical protein HanHA300_Chr15g0560791 [Helianthus annuus]KAJ0472703.1 hypothetical protein HanHA89_Chr15g0610031 [Helianthus annuus]KAJ0648307.1 hypothetical protein HanLR1_Chr15g0571411 [Helianthus annuus]KAJ0652144.1 hypothetical protein HanOQP8_Chr15g0568831 [Helianthus annuus]KAJ0844278.1 hypothetical protein HanRHA438_Chr15g0700641 [Helianthus annuus]
MFPFKTFKSICSRVLYNQERERERNYGRERQERDTTAAIRVPPQTQRRWRLWLTSQALVPAREECLMLFQQNSVIFIWFYFTFSPPVRIKIKYKFSQLVVFLH